MIPSVSLALSYDTTHFIDAAAHWEDLADRWAFTYGQVHAEAQGLPWEGLGAEALHERIGSDHRIASAGAESLRAAAKIARQEAPNLNAMHRHLLYSLEDAQQAGFNVGEDWSVADTRASRNAAEQAERQAQAQAFATRLRSQAGALLARDTEVSGNMTNAAAGVSNFADTGVYHKPNGSSDYVQFVDNHHKCTDDQADVEHKIESAIIGGAMIGGVAGATTGPGAILGALGGGAIGGIGAAIDEATTGGSRYSGCE
jgi:hypothetical protein